MKTIFFLLTILLVTGNFLTAQETFFPTQKGATLHYNIYDKKGKMENTLNYKVTNVVQDGDNTEITYLTEVSSTGKKPKIEYEQEITVNQQGDLFYFNLADYAYLEDISYAVAGITAVMGGTGSSTQRINKNTTVSASVSMPEKNITLKKGSLPKKGTIEGGQMSMPLNPQEGEELPEAEVIMKTKGNMKTSFINQEYTLRTLNRKVEAIEEITVKAGTFQCYKVLIDAEVKNSSKIKGLNTPKGLTVFKTYWYAKGIGIVKMLEEDANGKIVSSMELIKTENL